MFVALIRSLVLQAYKYQFLKEMHQQGGMVVITCLEWMDTKTLKSYEHAGHLICLLKPNLHIIW
jgi:drug/metabolite transporter superfamily protein YnfA